MSTWIEVAVHVPGELIEYMSYVLRQSGAKGVAIDDSVISKNTFTGIDNELLPEEKHYPGDLAVVKAYFPKGTEEKSLRIIEDHVDEAGITGVKIETSELIEEDWANAWKAYFKPVKVGRNIVVKPLWDEYKPGDKEVIINIDPGMAFGTGTHATTTLCLRMIEEKINAGDTIIDVGTGSGILAIASALLGASHVTAVDYDPVAVSVAHENVRENKVQSIVDVNEGDLLKDVDVCSDLVVANILAPVIINLVADVNRVLEPGGCFITSGISSRRAPEVYKAIEKAGFKIEKVSEEDQWVAIAALKE